MIQDELPEGLQYVSSLPEMHVAAGNHLSYKIPTLAAGSDKVITVKVKPTKTGPFDHAAMVRFESGCRSRTRVLEPKLKVDVVANPSTGKVLKGQPVEFKVTVTNLGDGPARNVSIQAKLTPGLRHDVGSKNDDPVLYEIPLAELLPGRSEHLDTFVADAVIGGQQSCTVTAKSPDVVFVKEDAEMVSTIAVVVPQLELHVLGPDSRFTDTIADYEVALKNPGTAAARKIRLTVTLPPRRGWSASLRPMRASTQRRASSRGASTRSRTGRESRFRFTCGWAGWAFMKCWPSPAATASSTPRTSSTRTSSACPTSTWS